MKPKKGCDARVCQSFVMCHVLDCETGGKVVRMEQSSSEDSAKMVSQMCSMFSLNSRVLFPKFPAFMLTLFEMFFNTI